jgi:hypothetical protein
MVLSKDVRPRIKGCPSIATSKITRLNIIKYIIICKYIIKSAKAEIPSTKIYKQVFRIRISLALLDLDPDPQIELGFNRVFTVIVVVVGIQI